MASRHSVPLPRSWSNHIKSGLLHAISLAAMALIVARSRSTGYRLQSELDRTKGEIALLNVIGRFKTSQSGSVQNRPG